jgi:pimeloyl-ACP methyl ester carboxylesterase
MSFLDLPARTVDVGGCPVRYRRLGKPGAPGMMLVHGAAAHAAWWLELAPELAADHDLVVMELSGHGDSGHREEYTPALWQLEAQTVLLDASLSGVTVVGHSMGGLVSSLLTAARPDLVGTLILLDSPIGKVARRDGPARQSRTRPSRKELLDGFKLLPPGTVADPRLLERVAAHGAVRAAEGWRWKADPEASQRFTNEEVDAALARITAPVGLVYGEHSSLAGPWTVERLQELLGRPVPAVRLRGAFHHLSLDAPAACARAVRQLAEALASRPGPAVG